MSLKTVTNTGRGVVKYYSVIKRNEVLTNTTTWMKISCEVEEDTTGHMLHDSIYMKISRIGVHADKNQIHGLQGLGEETWGVIKS